MKNKCASPGISSSPHQSRAQEPKRLTLAFQLALHNLLWQKHVLIAATAGIALSVVLIAFQIALYSGVLKQITTYIDNVGADLWIAQRGAIDLFSTSFVPRQLETELAELSGVRYATGIYAVYASLQVRNNHVACYLIGYDSNSGRGGPWSLAVAPQKTLAIDEIIADQHFARYLGVELGDGIPWMQNEFRLAGLSRETSALGCQYVFVKKEAIENLWPGGLGIAYTHVLLTLEEDTDRETIIEEIHRRHRNVRAIPTEDFSDNSRAYAGVFIVPLVTTGALLGVLIGLSTLGIVLYGVTVNRLQEYALLKALGANERWVLRIILAHSSILTAMGCFLGLPAAESLVWLANRYVLGLSADLSTGGLALTVSAVLMMALLSTLIPAYRVLKLDPAAIFRA